MRPDKSILYQKPSRYQKQIPRAKMMSPLGNGINLKNKNVVLEMFLSVSVLARVVM